MQGARKAIPAWETGRVPSDLWYRHVEALGGRFLKVYTLLSGGLEWVKEASKNLRKR